MKKYRKEIFIAASFVLVCVALILFDGTIFRILPDERADGMLQETISRLASALFLVPLILLAGEKKSLTGKSERFLHAILWCLPCLLVCVANFPFSALLSGEAKIERMDLLWLFLLKCLSIGLMEEFAFRALILPLLLESFPKRGELFSVLVSSALFGGWHILNLFGGASFGATALQVGYSFLIGVMLAAVFLRTGNVWMCVLLHALFDVGGLLVRNIGSGPFQDTLFWVFTVLAGIACTCHVAAFLLRREKQRRERKRDEKEADRVTK